MKGWHMATRVSAGTKSVSGCFAFILLGAIIFAGGATTALIVGSLFALGGFGSLADRRRNLFTGLGMISFGVVLILGGLALSTFKVAVETQHDARTKTLNSPHSGNASSDADNQSTHRPSHHNVPGQSEHYASSNGAEHVPMDQIRREVAAANIEYEVAVKPPKLPDDPDKWLADKIAQIEADEKAEEIASRPRAKVYPARPPNTGVKVDNQDSISLQHADYNHNFNDSVSTYARSQNPVGFASSGNSTISRITGLPKTNWVNGYTRKNGTSVKGYYRSHK